MSEEPPAQQPPAEPVGEGVERRQFVRRMGNDAVGIAGSVFGLSRVIRRSAAAAGKAIASELEGLQPKPDIEAEPVASAPIPEPSPPASASEAIAPTPAPAPVAAPTPKAPPPLTVDADQRALLEE